jgi:hypothetical protein
MGASTICLRLSRLPKRLFAAFTGGSPSEIRVDPDCVKAWLAEHREMRRQASHWAEMPPLPGN